MNIRHLFSTAGNRRRGVVAVQVAVVLVVLLGFAAMTIDVGRLYRARADLQRAADAAALAGASSYTSDTMMQVRMDIGDGAALESVIQAAVDRVALFSSVNASMGSPTLVEASDIATGWINMNSASDVIHTNPEPNAYNAIQVTVRRSSGSINGPVDLFFMSIFGKTEADRAASAVAVFDDRFSGITINQDGAGILPFTVHEDAFFNDLENGLDNYGWDGDAETVTGFADDIREIKLFPYTDDGSYDGAGNFGVLNIGTGNQGLEALRTQIDNGITPEDMEAEVGTSDLTFYDENGNPVSYEVTGSPGLDGGLADSIDVHVGQIVGFFLHNNVVEPGSNATYTITEMRFGRVMDILLTGPPSLRGMYIQPASYDGAGVQIDENAPSSGGLMGRLVLAR